MNRRNFIKTIGVIGANSFIADSSSLLANNYSDVPNIIYVLADDMGYGDISALNPQSRIQTPNIDRLAREGMSFTDAHSGSALLLANSAEEGGLGGIFETPH